MLSRVAENIYWLARHLERAENTARLVLVHSETRLDRPDRAGFYWEPALRITGTLGEFEARGLAQGEREATNLLLSDPQSPSSLVSTCAHARENARTLIEILPRESWEAVNALHQLAARPGAAAPRQRDEHLREVILRTQAMAGLFLGAMNDDAGYAVLRLGRAVERGDFVIRVLMDALAVVEESGTDAQALQAPEWIGVLKSVTAYQMYRRSVRGSIMPAGVVGFLACSTVFPRALAACIQEIEGALARLPDASPMLEVVARLFAILAAHSTVSDERRLTGVLARGQAEFFALHDAVSTTYFAPPPTVTRQTQGQSA